MLAQVGTLWQTGASLILKNILSWRTPSQFYDISHAVCTWCRFRATQVVLFAGEVLYLPGFDARIMLTWKLSKSPLKLLVPLHSVSGNQRAVQHTQRSVATSERRHFQLRLSKRLRTDPSSMFPISLIYLCFWLHLWPFQTFFEVLYAWTTLNECREFALDFGLLYNKSSILQSMLGLVLALIGTVVAQVQWKVECLERNLWSHCILNIVF